VKDKASLGYDCQQEDLTGRRVQRGEAAAALIAFATIRRGRSAAHVHSPP
jgi:hypothetical protein